MTSFRTRHRDFDRAVRNAADLDQFCSSSNWALPAYDGLMPTREPFIFNDGSDGWLTFAQGTTDDGLVYLEPFEAAWGLGCPLINVEPERALEVLAPIDWHLCLLLGVLDNSATQRALIEALQKRFAIQVGFETIRFVGDLTGGFDEFLSRRGRNLRRSIRRAKKRALEIGVTFENADKLDSATAFERICAVERLGWKDREGVGFLAASMSGFYQQMIEQLSQQGSLRLLFARFEERDVGYIFGGVFAKTYRGLQFSYSTEMRELGLGNLAQAEQIESLCREGVSYYDLGTTGEHYKARWADRQVASTALIAVRG